MSGGLGWVWGMFGCVVEGWEWLGTMGVRGWCGAGWVVCGEKWWKSVCLLVWCGAGGVVVWAVCICVGVPFTHGGVEEDSMSGRRGRAGCG